MISQPFLGPLFPCSRCEKSVSHIFQRRDVRSFVAPCTPRSLCSLFPSTAPLSRFPGVQREQARRERGSARSSGDRPSRMRTPRHEDVIANLTCLSDDSVVHVTRQRSTRINTRIHAHARGVRVCTRTGDAEHMLTRARDLLHLVAKKVRLFATRAKIRHDCTRRLWSLVFSRSRRDGNVRERRRL